MSFRVDPVTYPSELAGQTNGRLAPGLLFPIVGGWLLKNASISWTAMVNHARSDGIDLSPTSSVDTYRPYTVQESVFRQRYKRIPWVRGSRKWDSDFDGKAETWWHWYGASAAVPGTSNHGWGLAVDVASASGDRLRWLEQHTATYGWSWEIQSEPWHLRYTLGDRLPFPTAPPPPPPLLIATKRRKKPMFWTCLEPGGTKTSYIAIDGVVLSLGRLSDTARFNLGATSTSAGDVSVDEHYALLNGYCGGHARQLAEGVWGR